MGWTISTRFVCYARSSSQLTYTYKEGYELLQHQWMSFLTEQCPIARAERVPQVRHFGCNLRVNLGKYHTVWPISGLDMLSEAPYIYMIHLRKLLNHFNSNEHLSLQYIIIFPVQRGYPKSGVLCVQFKGQPQQKWHNVNHEGLTDAVRAPPIFLVHLRKVMKYFSSNGYLSS